MFVVCPQLKRHLHKGFDFSASGLSRSFISVWKRKKPVTHSEVPLCSSDVVLQLCVALNSEVKQYTPAASAFARVLLLEQTKAI